MNRKLLCLSLSVSLLSACIKVPNIRVCSVAGHLSAGATCAYTLSEKTEDLTLDEYIEFLSPDPEHGRGGALCSSAEDWNKMKTALEQACKKIKCDKEQLELLQAMELPWKP